MKKRTAAFTLSMMLAMGISSFAADEDADAWYRIYRANNKADGIILELPCEDEYTSWRIDWLNGKKSFSQESGFVRENGKMTASLDVTGERSGYSTFVASNELTGETKTLTVFTSEAGTVEVVQEGFFDTLPITEPLDMELSSGAGAWATLLTLDPDGTFEGGFHDSDMGETGPGYPEGTVYYSEFSGTFTSPFPAGPNMYGILLDNISITEPGLVNIEDGLQFVSCNPAGMLGYVYILCKPGTPLENMSQDALLWLMPDQEENETLTCYALYDKQSGSTFFSQK